MHAISPENGSVVTIRAVRTQNSEVSSRNAPTTNIIYLETSISRLWRNISRDKSLSETRYILVSRYIKSRYILVSRCIKRRDETCH